MKKASVAVAFRIAEILNEYDGRTIAGAVEVLRKYGVEQELLAFLLEAAPSSVKKPSKPRKGVAISAAPRSVFRDRLSLLETHDPSLYEAVLRFEELVGSGRVLKGSEELKRLGQTISKKFRYGKSRADALNSLLSELLNLNREEIFAVIKHVESGRGQSEFDEFQSLAHYLIGSRVSK